MSATLLAVLLAGCSSSPARTGSGTPGTTASPTPSSAPPQLSHVDVRIHVGGSPCGIADAAGALWVSDAADARLLRIDPVTHAFTKAAQLDDKPCEITAAFGSLWIVTQSGRLDRVDPTSGHVIARIPVGDTSYQAIAAGDAIWVSNHGDGTVMRVDPRTNRVTKKVELPGVTPGGLAYLAGALWIGDDSSLADHIARLDLATGAISSVPAGGKRPGYLTVADGAIWVSCVVDGTVSRIDATRRTVAATVHVGRSPVNLKPGPGPTPEVWVPDDFGNQVLRVNARAARLVEAVPAPEGGPAVVHAFRGGVWVTLFGSGDILRIQPASY